MANAHTHTPVKILHGLTPHLWDHRSKQGKGCSVLCWTGHILELRDTISYAELEAHLVTSEDHSLFINRTRWIIQMLSASGFHNTVKYTYSGHSYSDHLLDGTKKGPSSLSEYHRMTTGSHPRFPVERSSRYWQKLTSLLLRFCGLALCQNRILFKLKILLIQVKKKKQPCFAVFITKFVGGETLTFLKKFFFIGTFYGSEETLYLAG